MAAPFFDVLIIGGGQAGVPLAHGLAAPDRRVALAERKHLGGSCVNFGCTPTKAVIASAHLAHQARRAADYGLRIPTVEVDFAAVIERARDLSDAFREGIEESFAGSGNPRLLVGHARFVAQTSEGFRLRVGDETVEAGRVVLNVGTRSRFPDIAGLTDGPVVHAGNWLDLTARPDHLVVIGGGPIGLEMGQFYRRMGSRVTILEAHDQIAGTEDADVAAALGEALEDEGVTMRTNAATQRVAWDDDGVRVTVQVGEAAPETIAASHVFAAAGRVPNTDDLGLDAVGVPVDDHGYLIVDDALRTAVTGIWGAGDVCGGPQFTHRAWDDHRIVQAQLTGAPEERTTNRIVPYAIFTDPQLGRAGLTEKEARAQGLDIEVARYEAEKNGRMQEEGTTRGFVKVVISAETREILGVAACAAEGAELVHPYLPVMRAGLPYTVLYEGMHIHPTRSEAVHSVLGGFG